MHRPWSNQKHRLFGLYFPSQPRDLRTSILALGECWFAPNSEDELLLLGRVAVLTALPTPRFAWLTARVALRFG